MAALFCFKYSSVRRIQGPRGTRFRIRAPKGSEFVVLDENEFTLAKLFNGERSLEQALDQFFKDQGLRVRKEDAREFIGSLERAGMMERRDVPDPEPFSGFGPVPLTLDGESSRVEETVDFAGPWSDETGMGQDSVMYGGDFGAPDAPERETPHVAGRHGFAGGGSGFPGAGGGVSQRRQTLVLRLPVRGLYPLGTLLGLGARNLPLFILLFFLAVTAAYGVWNNRVEAAADVVRMFAPLNLFQALLLSMVSVNFLRELAKAAAYARIVGHPPDFGIILLLGLIPRFHAEVSDTRSLSQPGQIAATSLCASLALFVVSAYGWVAIQQNATYLPLLLVGVATFSAILFLFSANPLSRSDGYALLSGLTGVQDLRERALLSLFGMRPRYQGAGDALSPWGLRLYGLLILAYLGLISYLIVVGIGGWLEANLRGLGVLLFLGLLLWSVVRPVLKIRAKRKDMVLRRPGQALSMPPRANQPHLQFRHGTRGSGSRRWLYLGLVALFLVLGSLPYTYEAGGDAVILPNERADIRSLIAGDIREIYVAEGDVITAGTVIASISDDEEQKNIKVSESRLRELQAKLAIARTGATREELELARQKVKTARTKANFSSERATRMKEIYQKKFLSQQEYENALAEAEVDKEHLVEQINALRLVEKGVRDEEIDSILAEIEKEEAQLAYHQDQLKYTEVRSPIAGRVVSGSLRFAKGDYLERGDLLAVVEDTREVLAEIRVPESDIGEVEIGSPVRLKVWGYADREFTGKVLSIAPNAEQSEYGKVIRVVTRINNASGMLKSEMTGFCKVAGHRRPAFFAFTRQLFRFFQIELWSWIP